MKELNWGGLGSSYAASKLITRREPFSLVITGKAADALKSVAGPGARFDRELLAKVASNLSCNPNRFVWIPVPGRGSRPRRRSCFAKLSDCPKQGTIVYHPC